MRLAALGVSATVWDGSATIGGGFELRECKNMYALGPEKSRFTFEVNHFRNLLAK